MIAIAITTAPFCSAPSASRMRDMCSYNTYKVTRRRERVADGKHISQFALAFHKLIDIIISRATV